jgi:hypothetical protein
VSRAYRASELTPCNRVLPEKLKGPQLVKKFFASYETWIFMTSFTKARRLSLARSIQSVPHPSYLRSILILSFCLLLGFPSGLLLCFPHHNLMCTSLFPHLGLLDLITRIIFGEEYRSQSSSLCSLLQSPVTSSLLVYTATEQAHF